MIRMRLGYPWQAVPSTLRRCASQLERVFEVASRLLGSYRSETGGEANLSPVLLKLVLTWRTPSRPFRRTHRAADLARWEQPASGSGNHQIAIQSDFEGSPSVEHEIVTGLKGRIRRVRSSVAGSSGRTFLAS